MHNLHDGPFDEERLEELLATPTRALIEDMKNIDGDIMVLGAGGKMGPSLCRLIRNAATKAGVSKEVIAISRFSDKSVLETLEKQDIRAISCDLLDVKGIQKLPDVENIIYMAGKKFGSEDDISSTWAINAAVPALVSHRFKGANMVVFSSGNIYPMVDTNKGAKGSTEDTQPSPIGEYAMSCLARERIFEYAAQHFGTKVLTYRLNYAVDLRYGVIYDIAQRIQNRQPISLAAPYFNCIWQGSANEWAIRSLLHTASPASILNITGPETVSVKYTAERLGQLLNIGPIYEEYEGTSALLNDASKALGLFGAPQFAFEQLLEMQADWLLQGGRGLGKPTHFEVKDGVY